MDNDKTFCKQDGVDLREFFNTKIDNILTLIDGNDKNYNTQFINAKESVVTALNAQEKAVAITFAASEKAIVKAEDAQKDYNQRSNEFRGQLDDQAKTLMPRAETLSLFKGMDEKLLANQTANEKVFDRLTTDINSLREFRSEGRGRFSQTTVDTLASRTQWIIIFGIVSSLVGIAGLVITLIRMSLGK